MSDTAERPYPGPLPFRQEDREWFSGRATDAGIVAEWWRTNRLTLMVGEAGCGKTSLLHAGVLPLLGSERLDVLPVGRFSDGVAFPSAALPPHNPYTLALLCSWSPDETATRLAGLSVREFFRRRAGRGVILAAIDPADELLAAPGVRRTHRQRFLRELKEAVDEEPRLHLLAAGREEAINVMARVLGNGARYSVAALTPQDACEAVSRPMARAGRPFADGAAAVLVTDLRTSHVTGDDGAERAIVDEHVEPVLLQIACARLWESLPAEVNQITARDIRWYADVDAALAAYSGTVIAQVADRHDRQAKGLHSWLLSTFVTEFGTLGKVYEGRADTARMPNAVARALEERHLLTVRLEAGTRWYQLLSARLIEPLRNALVTHAPPGSPEEYLRAAEHAFTLDELDLAGRYAELILTGPAGAKLRTRAAACSLLGNLAYERAEPEQAEARYREAAELYGALEDNRAVAYQLVAVGQVLQNERRLPEAVAELHAAVRRVPNDPVAQTQLAQALWQDGQGQAAVAILNDVLRSDGGNRTALRARGEILAYLGEARQAMLDLDRVPLQGQPSARAARGLALAGLGDQRAARREIEDAIIEGQHSGPVLLYAARAFALAGDEGAAEAHARKATDATDPPLSPRHFEAARQLAGRG